MTNVTHYPQSNLHPSKGVVPCYFLKSDVLDLLKISSTEYNDLTRPRPEPRVANKVIFGRSFEFDDTPFFVPLHDSRRGSGYNQILCFADLMILYMLASFKRQGIDRSIGKFIRKIILDASRNPKIHLSEQVWTEWFQGSSEKDRSSKAVHKGTEVAKWELYLALADDGRQELQLKKGNDSFEQLGLYMDKDLGLIEMGAKNEKGLLPPFAELSISLEFINKALWKLIPAPAFPPDGTAHYCSKYGDLHDDEKIRVSMAIAAKATDEAWERNR